jgi:hypothetical protein
MARAAFDASLTGLLGLATFFIGFGQPLSALKGPLGQGDMSYYYAVANAQGLRGEVSPHLGYPFGLDTAYFPGTDLIQITVARVLSWITGTVFLGVNAVYVLSFAGAAVACWLACRIARINRGLSITIALAFTALPTHWFRIEHTWLATIYSVAVSLAIALIILSGRLDGGRKGEGFRWRRWAILSIALSLVVAWSGLYYTFYGCLIIVIAMAFRISKVPARKDWLLNLIPLVVIGAGTGLAMLPGVIARVTTGVAAGYERPIYDAILYGGQLADSILPTTVSMMPVISSITDPLNDLNDWANQANAIGVRWTADQGTTLTLIAALVLLAWLAAWGGSARVRPGVGRAALGRADASRAYLVYLAVTAALVAFIFVPFGLSAWFSTAVTLSLRGWDRMIILFQLLLLVSLGLVVQLALMRLRRERRRIVMVLVIAFAGVTVLLDTVLPARSYFAGVVARGAEQVHPNSLIVEQVNAIAGDDCAVLQLPYRRFPEAPNVERLGVYEPLWLGLMGRQNMWSYGGVFGSPQDLWLERVATDPVANLGELKATGFCAITVDARGYDQEGINATQAQLTSALGQPSLVQGVEPVLIYRLP